jgi:hypothetical protein
MIMLLQRHFGQNFARAFFPLILLSVLLLLLGCVYLYFGVYQKRNQFPDIKSTVDRSILESAGYRNIEVEDNSYSFFVPVRWTLIDKEINVYGDLLTGSNAYMKRYPNSLGKLTSDVCNQVAKESVEVFRDKPLYTNFSLEQSFITKINDFEGCRVDFKTTIAANEFRISQFYAFRKENIYTLFVQYPEKLSLEKENADVILGSIIINE